MSNVLISMNTLVAVLFSYVGCLSFCWAEGPPTVSEVPHLTIILSEKQVEQVSRSHWIRLDKDQTELVQRLHPTFKGGVSVITSLYNDCSCGLGNFAIWKSRNSLAFSVEGSWGEYDEWDDEDPGYGGLYIDHQGKFWVNGKKATEEIVKALCVETKKMHKDNKESGLPYSFVTRPPILDADAEAHLVKKIEDLQKLMTSKGVKLFGYGLNFEEEPIE